MICSVAWEKKIETNDMALCRPFRCSDLHTVELDKMLIVVHQTGLAQNRLLYVVFFVLRSIKNLKFKKMQDKSVILHLKVAILLLCIVLAKMSIGTNTEIIWECAALFYLITIAIFLVKNARK